MIHRPYFFDSVRASLFSGHLTQQQVDGCTVFLDWYDIRNPPIPERYHLGDRELAYVLATTYHETAQTMAPIAEYGNGSGQPYGTPDPQTGQTYYGRGYVQLTWKENYQHQDNKLQLGGRLVTDAAMALEPIVALQVILGGMVDGDFTGQCLGDWITADDTNFYDARTIVNGHDRATDIAGYAVAFCNALTHL